MKLRQPFKKLIRLLAICLVSILSACTSFSPKPESEPVSTNYNWQQLAPKLAAFTHWQLIGKLGVRTETDSATAAINTWVQQRHTFDIQLSSTFLGLGATRIYGNPQFITLHESGEDPLYSYEPDLLIAEALGLSLPISAMPYWIRALPSPGSQHQLTFNLQGLPAKLQQDGWQIHYSRYQTLGGIDSSDDLYGVVVPHKIKLHSASTRITFAIKNWQTLPATK